LRGALSGPPAVAAVDAPWAPLYIFVCFVIHPWIGALAFFGGVLLVGLAWWNQAAMHKSMRANDQATGAMYGMQQSDSQHGDTARSLGMQGALVQRQMQARETMSDSVDGATRGNALFSSSTKFVRLALQSASLGLGAYLALQQEISAGGIIASAILTARAYAPLETIVGAWRQFEQARIAYGTLNKVLKSQEAQRADYTALPAPSGRLSVENVGLLSPQGDRHLLMGASFKAEPGEIVGVVGPSGAGKTTLMRVVSGAVRPDQGAVRLDGAKLTDWQADRLGRYIGYLPQEVALLSGTITENISRFERLTENGDDIDEAVVAAAKVAGAHEMILTLPRGYDTPIGPNGLGLSAGQAQRVALARALYRDPVLIVLDEPNAHLDHEGELALANALKSAKDGGALVIVVAHRTSFMNIADKLCVVNNGRIDSFGPRDQVVAKLSSNRPTVVEPAGRRP